MTQTTKIEKFKKLISNDIPSWTEKAKWRKENRKWINASQHISLKILRSLREQNLTQVDLALKLDLTPQYVNKVLKGQEENFTLKTIFKIQDILGIVLIYVDGYNANIEYVAGRHIIPISTKPEIETGKKEIAIKGDYVENNELIQCNVA